MYELRTQKFETMTVYKFSSLRSHCGTNYSEIFWKKWLVFGRKLTSGKYDLQTTLKEYVNFKKSEEIHIEC